MHELSPGAPGVEGRLTGAGTQGSAARLEASAWGRGGGDAGVRGGRTRSRTLGPVDGTSEGPGTGAGRVRGKERSRAAPGEGTTVLG